MNFSTPSTPGFSDPVPQAQQAFRNCLMALSRPGLPRPVTGTLPAIEPVYSAALEVVLALADYETNVWLDAQAAASTEVSDYIRFHTGARLSQQPDEADFAIVTDPMHMPRLSDFKQGIPDYPDRSTTVIVQVSELNSVGWVFAGPGIDRQVAFGAHPLPSDFAAQLSTNRQNFPCGVDLLFVTGEYIVGLPRSASIVEPGRN